MFKSRFCLPLALSGIFLLLSTLAMADDPAPKEDAKQVEKQPGEPAPKSIFPDPALEDAVRKEVFSKRTSRDPLTQEDVANISRVIGKSKKIKNLEGLQHCAKLMLIDLEDNQIVDLTPLASLNKLQSVTLAGNQIRNISPLAKLSAMQLLDLSRNQITELGSLKAMQNLRTLYVADNRLTQLDPLRKLERIWSLDIANNQIESLDPIGKLGWMTTLEATGNKIRSLDFVSGLKQLRTLMIGDNPIEDLAPLVKACEADASSDRWFAPYLDVYLSNNSIGKNVLAQQLEKLKSAGVNVSQD